ncbi:MAG: efflux transporter outer membrane subunit [Betaproteobacteria bacterium]|nr:MAG: efflux transporter outer membrane subunit [Betaproteobacteria bacterium]
MRKLSILGFAFLLAACAGLKPDYTKPAVDLPAGWRDAPADGVQARDARWWKVYGDPVLDRLVDEALAHNANVMLAIARVDEARAALSATSADQRPQVSASANRSRTRVSQRGPTPLPQGVDPQFNDTRVAVGVSYEIDLWGRLRNATQAARAELLASEAARETVLITLTSDVAQGYFALRAFDGQLEATRRSLAARSEALGMQKKRFDVGDISEFDYRQLQADVAADRALLPALELQRAQQENALAVLLGKSPRAIYEGALEAGSDPEDRTLAIVVPAGLPSDLLLRRPDLIQAEQTLIAANARVAVARAAYFPTLSLTGTLGSESVALSDLFTGPAGMWQAALAAGQPIYAGGRIDAQVQAAGARERQALAQYQLAIQNAFRDVRDALVAQAKARERLEAESERVTALRTTLRFARLRYQNGMTGQLEVLDAERNLLAAEQNRIDALRSQRAAIADLFKALGGVWS